MALSEANFVGLFDRLKTVDLFGDGPPAPPWDGAPTAAQVTDAIRTGADHIPRAFAESYVTPLEQAAPHVVAVLQQQPDLIETLAGAVYQHADAEVAADLHRFLAVVSNFYRSFVSDRRRLAAGFPLVEQEPPLAMFQHHGGMGPFTVTVDNIQRLTGGTVGVVSLPATYRAHPVTWAALAHETGGHDVLHADPGLLPELTAGVKAMFGGGPVDPSGPINSGQLLGALWAHWIDESASDIYGVLNIGPTFSHSLAVLLAALGAREQPGAPPSVRTGSGADRSGLLDPHPTDLLRLDLAIGAVQGLHALHQGTRSRYVHELRQLSVLLGQHATSIQLQGILPVDGQRAIRLNTELPLPDMQAAARRVGAFIATGRLQALDGHGIQDLETWDDADEQTARTIAEAIAAGTPITGAGDDAQLLAGTMLALLGDATRYDQATKLLQDALDESYVDDPIWGPPQPDLLWLRGETVLAAAILTDYTAEVVQVDGTALPSRNSPTDGSP